MDSWIALETKVPQPMLYRKMYGIFTVPAVHFENIELLLEYASVGEYVHTLKQNETNTHGIGWYWCGMF